MGLVLDLELALVLVAVWFSLAVASALALRVPFVHTFEPIPDMPRPCSGPLSSVPLLSSAEFLLEMHTMDLVEVEKESESVVRA